MSSRFRVRESRHGRDEVRTRAVARRGEVFRVLDDMADLLQGLTCWDGDKPPALAVGSRTRGRTIAEVLGSCCAQNSRGLGAADTAGIERGARPARTTERPRALRSRQYCLELCACV